MTCDDMKLGVHMRFFISNRPEAGISDNGELALVELLRSSTMTRQ